MNSKKAKIIKSLLDNLLEVENIGDKLKLKEMLVLIEEMQNELYRELYNLKTCGAPADLLNCGEEFAKALVEGHNAISFQLNL